MWSISSIMRVVAGDAFCSLVWELVQHIFSTMHGAMVGVGSFISCEEGVVLGEVVSYLLSSVQGDMVGSSLFHCY